MRVALLLVALFYRQAAQAARGTRPDPTDRPGRPEYDEEKILVSFEGKMPPGLVSVIDGIGYLKVNRGNGETVEKALKRAEKLPGFKAAATDDYLYPDLTPNDPFYLNGALWNMNKIQAPKAWDTTTGGNTEGWPTVCVVDSAIDYTHNDLKDNYIKGRDFVEDDFDPMDDGSGSTYGHATHVSGIVTATGNNGIGVVGVNHKVRLLACRMLGPDLGQTGAGLKCIDWCLSEGADVISNSWSAARYNVLLEDLIKKANAQGVLFVASAGNNAKNNDVTPQYPASYKVANVISVAATTSTDSLASFSNYGPKTVHLAAPGASILSTSPGNSYTRLSGTSMSCPHVSGAAALLLSACKQKYGTCPLKGADMKSYLLRGVDTNRNLGTKVSSKGRLNVNKAMSLLLSATLATP